MSETIVVTGATGKTGSKLVTLLADQGIPVRAIVRSATHAEPLKRPNVEIAAIDTSYHSWDQAFRDASKAFIVTPFAQDQIAIAHPMIEAAAQAHLKHIVRLSVIGAQTEQIELLRQHHVIEKQIEATGIPYTFLRPNSFMQNLLGYAGTIKSINTFFQPTGESRVSYIDNRDVAAVAARVLTTPGYEGKTFTLTGSEALSHSEIARLMSQATGHPISYVNVSDDTFRDNLIKAGLPAWMVSALMDLMSIQSDNSSSVVTSHVKNITGHDPIRMEQFLQENADAFQA